MAQVSLHINGYAYILGCADGEEEHLFGLAADLDRRIQEVKGSAGPSGEARMLLMAALVLSDELHDLRDDLQRLETRLHQEAAQHREALQQQEAGQHQDAGQHQPDTAQTTKAEPKAGRRLRGLTRRAEAIAASAEALPESGEPEPSADSSS